MIFAYSFVMASLVYFTNGENGFLPPYIKPCHIDDENLSNCVREQIQIALPKFTKGIPELEVPSIDPVNLSNIEIDGSGLKLSFTKAAMHGLSKSKLTDFKINIGKGEETFTLGFKGDLSLTAKYVIDGKILILPIQGNGDSKINAQGVEVVISSKLEHVKDDRGSHFKLVAPNYKYTIERTTFDLKNLFNGNKELADTTLHFANENWEQLMDELAPPVIKQIVKTCVSAINKFFVKTTIEQIVIGYKEAN